MNHFKTLNLPITFDLNSAELDEKYFELQKLAHPDVVQNAVQAAHISADLNEAYQTLKDPIKRAAHILALEGIRLEGHEIQATESLAKPSPQLLEEMMELGEQVDAISTEEQAVETMKNLQQILRDEFRKISQSFANKDLPALAQNVMKAKFINRLIENTQAKSDYLGSVYI
jgi:molecular chaperone HscB